MPSMRSEAKILSDIAALGRGFEETQMRLGMELLSSFVAQTMALAGRAIDIEQQRYADANAKDLREHEFHLAALKAVQEARR
jgi:hypothetical protein